jgi:hypothetical protein
VLGEAAPGADGRNGGHVKGSHKCDQLPVCVGEPSVDYDICRGQGVVANKETICVDAALGPLPDQLSSDGERRTQIRAS